MPWTYELADLFSDEHAPIKSVAFSQDGTLIATADVRRMVRVWKGSALVFAKRYRATWDRLRAIDHVRALHFNRSGSHLLIGAGNRCRVVELATGQESLLSSRKATLGFMVTCPQAITVSAQDQVAIANDDGVIEVVDFKSRRPISSWADNEAPSILRYTYDGQKLVGSDRYCICVWDPLLGTKVGRLAADKVYGLEVSPVSNLVAVRSLRQVAIWDVESGEMLTAVDTSPGLPTLSFSHDGMFFAAGDRSGFSIYAINGLPVDRISTPAPVISLSFSPAEEKIAVATANGKFSLCDYSKGAIETQ